MTREEVTDTVNGKLKLVRTEYGLTQDKFAAIEDAGGERERAPRDRLDGDSCHNLHLR